jgi:hypothetical protein
MRLPLGLLSVLASMALATPAAAHCRLFTQSPSTSQPGGAGCVELGAPLSWWQQCISYTVVPNEQVGIDPEAVRDVVDSSFAAWTSLQCRVDETLPLVLGQTSELGACTQAEYNRFGPNANTVVFVRDWTSRGKDYVPEAYGLTLVWHDPDTGEILDADIQINMNRGALTLCGEQCADPMLQVDLQNVLTHEAGHFLGLAHSDDPIATMYGDADEGETIKRSLEVDDVGGMCEIYGLLEKPVCEPKDFAPRRGFTATCSQPPDTSSCAARSGPVRDGALSLGAIALIAIVATTRRRRGFGYRRPLAP